MTAQIAGFVTRAAAGLRAPKSVSRNITPGKGGVAGHYGGPKQSAAEPDASHELCVSTWRKWQAYHMNTKGWADIAYTGGFCNHGYAFAGRGAGVRTAANGTNDGNQRFYAVTWIGGEGQTPTQAARDAFEWWVAQLRKQGAGRECRPHRYFKATGCPGDPVVGFCAALHLHDTDASTPITPHAGEAGEVVIIVKEPGGARYFACDRAGATHIFRAELTMYQLAGIPIFDDSYAPEGRDGAADRREFLIRHGVADAA